MIKNLEKLSEFLIRNNKKNYLQDLKRVIAQVKEFEEIGEVEDTFDMGDLGEIESIELEADPLVESSQSITQKEVVSAFDAGLRIKLGDEAARPYLLLEKSGSAWATVNLMIRVFRGGEIRAEDIAEIIRLAHSENLSSIQLKKNTLDAITYTSIALNPSRVFRSANLPDESFDLFIALRLDRILGVAEFLMEDYHDRMYNDRRYNE